MKIEVRNEVCPPPPPRAAYPRGLRLGRDPVVVIGIVAPFTPRGVGISGKLLFSRSRGVNAFVCVDNGLPAALPLASPRLKIPMAPIGVVEWPPGQGTWGVGILGKLLFSRNWWLKCRGVLVKSKTKIEVRNEVWPPPPGLPIPEA